VIDGEKPEVDSGDEGKHTGRNTNDNNTCLSSVETFYNKPPENSYIDRKKLTTAYTTVYDMTFILSLNHCVDCSLSVLSVFIFTVFLPTW